MKGISSYIRTEMAEEKQYLRLDKIMNTPKKGEAFLQEAISDIFNGDIDNIIEFKRRISIGSDPFTAEYGVMLSYIRRLDHRKKIKKAMETIEEYNDLAYISSDPFLTFARLIK
jgi:hypothetical protein